MCGLCVLEPELEARDSAALRVEASAGRLAGERRRIASRSVPLVITTGIPRRWPSPPPRPSSASRPSRVVSSHADVVALELLEPADIGDQLGVRIAARVGGMEPAGVGEQDQPVGADQDRHLCREEVVVAEGDVVGRGGVVLVDYRDHVPVEQLAQRRPGVEVVRARGHVEEGQQDLRRPHAALLEELVVVAVELALPHRRGGLELLHPARAHRQLHQPHAARDRPRRDDDRLLAVHVARGNLVA